MIGSTRSLRVWAYPAPTDLRKGFDGLCGLVTQLHQDPLAGDCFLVVNRLRTRAKVLLWDGTGLCVYHERLDQGRFAALWSPDGQATPARTLTLSELSLFLEGCTLLTRTALSPGAVTPRQWTPRLGTSAWQQASRVIQPRPPRAGPRRWGLSAIHPA